MRKYKFIIALDPSGSFNEGKGTTGYSVFNSADKTFIKLGKIQASGYECKEAYWDAHLKLLEKLLLFNTQMKKNRCKHSILVIEDYLLYANKAESQINSRMETSKLIGIIQHWCYKNKIPYVMQTASQVKSRWTDNILHYKGYLKKKGNRYEVCEHTRDSMRHAIHYATFRNEVEENGK